MAGNIVKWWKHKILGGYKQFSVLQECATDSEELIYPIRAPSSCSAPPDLLLTGDRTKDAKVQSTGRTVDGISPERMLLEEFTCDVSVEGGGKSTQPLQFSFTFYDLDGHHGKITKDDIAGIVYTIYESIGKSVVVPHFGSKTINVRLTVSPDSKSKSSTNSTTKITKKQRLKPRKLLKCDDEEDGSGSGGYFDPPIINEQSQPIHCADVNSVQQKQEPTSINVSNSRVQWEQSKSNVYVSEKQQQQQQQQHLFEHGNRTPKESENRLAPCCLTENLKTPVSQESLPSSSRRQPKPDETAENVYESAPLAMANKLPAIASTKSKCEKLDLTFNNNSACCRDCRVSTQCPNTDNNVMVASVKPSVRKLVRKSRSRKQKVMEACPARIRSLSVGNETSFRNGNRRGVNINGIASGEIEMNGDVSSGASGKERNEECLNNLRRNDLIDIIRESMEKSRLCFQSNGKTNVSPSKYHRHRSHTISSKATPNELHHHQIDPNSTTPPTNLTSGQNASKINWCGYDSMLHAKICSTNNIISNPVLAAHTSKLLHNYNSNNINNAGANNNNNNSNSNSNNNNNNNNNNVSSNNNRNSRSRHRHHNEFTIAASPQIQGYTKLMSTHNTTKLNTALLNQLNPQLTHEQKLSRTMNHVEKWLAEDQSTAAVAATATSTIVTTPNILNDPKNINCKENNNLCKDDSYLNANNITAMDKLKMSDKISKKVNETPSPKKTFNKEILLTRKTPKSITSQRNSSNSETPKMISAKTPTPPPSQTQQPQPKENIMEYASIPIIVDPSQSECENLLRASSDESCSQIGFTDVSLTTVHRYVHIHHHYHHFDDGSNNVDADLIDGGAEND